MNLTELQGFILLKIWKA